MKANKSHSGGSDADDESVLPAKQPNRKRLSTVSFASTNFVCASPEDLTPSMASRGSPLCGLSFVSKDSSYRSADGTFTPGSGRMLRSSVGSASGFSSAGESVIDPEEEVTITNNTKQLQGELELLSQVSVFFKQPLSFLGDSGVGKHTSTHESPPTR